MTSEFDRALALEPDEPNVFRARLSDRWSIGEAVHGGLLMALSASAAVAVAPDSHPHPFTYSGVFESPGSPGEARIDAQILRSGRTMTTAQVSVTQGRSERLRALLTLGDLLAHAEPVRKSPPPVDIAPIEDCIASTDAPESALTAASLLQRVELRMDPATVGWAVGKPSGAGELRAWVRLGDGRDPDPASLLFFLDVLPPVAFDIGAQGWVPTIEFSGYVRAMPAPGWLAVQLTTTTATGGLLEENARIWDSTGRLVAHSCQLASARYPTSD